MTMIHLEVDSDFISELVTSTAETPLLNHDRYAQLSPGLGWDLVEIGQMQWTRSLGDALIVHGYHRTCGRRTTLWWDILCDSPVVWVADRAAVTVSQK